MGLVMDWQKKLGYQSDPFSDKVAPAAKYLIGMSALQERLNLFLIKQERFGTIAGDEGTGKSLLLQWMEEELARQKDHDEFYFDARGVHAEQMLQDLLAPRLSFIERRLGSFRKKSLLELKKELMNRLASRKTVLLIDNAGSLGSAELELLGDIAIRVPVQMIFCDTPGQLRHLKLPESFVDVLKLTVPHQTTESLSQILTARIAAAGGIGTYPFSEADVKDLARNAKQNPSAFLRMARERAIELSLTALPKKPQPASSGKLFSIKVQRVGATPVQKEAEVDDAPSQETVYDDRAESVIEVAEELPKDEIDDANMLEKVVTQSVMPKKVHTHAKEVPVDVESILVGAKKKPAPKSAASFETLAKEFAHKHVKKAKKRR